MHVTVFCPGCGQSQVLETPDRTGAGPCPDCKIEVPFDVIPAAVPEAGPGKPLETCPICGFEQLYARKDFPRKLGLLVVAIGAVLSIPTHFISLLVVLVVEAAIYPFVSSLTGCYRCRSLFRGVPRNPEHSSFEHGVALPLANWKPPPRSSPVGPVASPPTPGAPSADPSPPSDHRG